LRPHADFVISTPRIFDDEPAGHVQPKRSSGHGEVDLVYEQIEKLDELSVDGCEQAAREEWEAAEKERKRSLVRETSLLCSLYALSDKLRSWNPANRYRQLKDLILVACELEIADARGRLAALSVQTKKVDRVEWRNRRMTRLVHELIGAKVSAASKPGFKIDEAAKERAHKELADWLDGLTKSLTEANV
jgi:hypothetical protein